MPTRRLRRGGFSFAEVMFAVIILGVGFIMVAALFPVAIQQTRLTVEESSAAAVAREAVTILDRLAAMTDLPNGQQYFPETQMVGSNVPPLVASIRNWPSAANGAPPQPSGLGPLPATPDLWGLLRGNLIVSGDPRFAWSMVFSREAGSSYIRAYIFVVQQTLGQAFSTLDTTNVNPAGVVNLAPRLIRINVDPAPSGSADPDMVRLTEPPDFKYAAPGAFVVVGSGTNAGTIYRLGNYRGLVNGADTYELDPAYSVVAGSSYSAEAWIMGRCLTTNQVPNPSTDGPAMDVAVYVTFVKVN